MRVRSAFGIRDIWDTRLGSNSKNATHGLTPRLVRAKFMGSWQRWRILNGGGKSASERGSPISSYASRLAVTYAVSWRESALPPGKAACPASARQSVLTMMTSLGRLAATQGLGSHGQDDSQFAVFVGI
jgi:hypothetical protein